MILGWSSAGADRKQLYKEDGVSEDVAIAQIVAAVTIAFYAAASRSDTTS
jgi:hypothetical protein